MSSDRIGLVFATSWLTFLVVMLIFAYPMKRMWKTLRKEAVEKGYAEYVTDSDGITTWRWKDEAK